MNKDNFSGGHRARNVFLMTRARAAIRAVAERRLCSRPTRPHNQRRLNSTHYP